MRDGHGGTVPYIVPNCTIPVLLAEQRGAVEHFACFNFSTRFCVRARASRAAAAATRHSMRARSLLCTTWYHGCHLHLHAASVCVPGSQPVHS